MTARICLVGARTELRLMVAGLAATCGAEVHEHSPMAPGAGPSCDLLLVDAVGLAEAGGDPGRDLAPGLDGLSGRVLLVHLTGEAHATRRWASVLGADHLVELPAGLAWLADRLVEHAQVPTVLAVIGAVGGAGTTTVALACAAAVTAGASRGHGRVRPVEPVGVCLLVDGDPRSTGLDLPLGISDGQGARWADLPTGGGPLVAESLRAGLPHVGGIAVVTGPLDDPADARVAAVLGAGREGFAATVVDVGRGPVPASVTPQEAVALVVPATLAGLVGAHRVVADVGTSRTVLVVRPTGWLPAPEVAQQLGVERYVVVPHVRDLPERADCGDVLAGRVGRALARAGARIWEQCP